MGSKDYNELAAGNSICNGKYEIQKVHGANQFGIDYVASDASGKIFILKELFPAEICARENGAVITRAIGAQDEFDTLKNAFLEDAGKLVSLSNPHIAEIVEWFEENGTAYMVVEALAGISLFEAVSKNTIELTPADKSGMLVKLLKSLHAIHEKGLLHRDIEPLNIAISQDKEPMLFVGFGTLTDKSGQRSRAVSKVLAASNSYMSLEMRISPENQSAASDIYSLAASFYFAISGEPPIGNLERVSDIAQGKSDPYVPLEGRFPEYDQILLKTIDLALSANPDERIHHATEWLQYLKKLPAADSVEIPNSLIPEAHVPSEILSIPYRALRRVAVLASFGLIAFLSVKMFVGA
jgi:serine/threonine protein kinase